MTKQARGTRVPTTRVPVSMPEENASGQWLRSIRLSGFAITALSLIVLFVVVLAPSLRIFIDQRQQIAALESQNAAAKAAVGTLNEQKARWDDPTYVESLARQRLNYVIPGEFSYLVIDDGKTATAQSGQPISDKIQTTQVDWLGSLLSSVFTAGLTDAPANKIVAPVITGSQ
ncbi:septum formation initiator family protein [Lacisediminihabitans sp.]|jgi:cell division protein FtsB|uniref:FtsB family cell division protein n=1 Tax=Lacisediminihabitans sp. TaxID=2787631 RepID=UPI002F924405